jgi:peptidoglycan hydrolase-like protein with peptidoglycan-binding domain
MLGSTQHSGFSVSRPRSTPSTYGEGPPVQIDGIFGPRTDGFVRGFQSALGIASDGIVGPLTWRALVSGMLSG